MSKEAPYKRNHDFVVTSSVPCPQCSAFYKEGEIIKRTRYVYPVGYTELVSCQPCFNKAVEQAQAEAKKAGEAYRANIYGDYMS